MNRDLYERIVQGIDTRFLTDRLKEMVAIKSENPLNTEAREGYREKEMGEYLLETMAGLGLEVESRDIKPGRSNVFGYLKGRRDTVTLMLAGHMDTAPTEGYGNAYDVREEEGNIYGRGACDMKAALAAYLEVTRILREADVHLEGNLTIGGIIDEEYQMLGSKDVGENGPHADQGIIGEPSNLQVCPSNKGQLGTIIQTFGKSVHSSVPERGENAIVNMTRVIQAFSDYNDELLSREPHPSCGHARFNPGVIKGGTIVSIVPDLCELEVDRRVLPGETKEKIYDELRSRLDTISRKYPPFTYEMTEPTWDIPANDISHNEPVVQSLLSAYESVMGEKKEVTAFPAGTDAPNMGFPTVICGPGSVEQAHSKNEFVPIKQMVFAVRMYLWTILDLLLIQKRKARAKGK